MSNGDKKKILLVDDEKHLLVSLRDYLVFENYTVNTARSGEEALKILEKETPDLIILDISMPGMGGVGFLRRISDDKGIPKFPVLVLTARSAMREFFDTVEVDGFMEKPCEESDLVTKIRRILARRHSGKEGRAVSGRSVLLAEDDASVATRLSQAFAGAGFDVEVVRSGPEALEKAAALKPDVILMKENLPRLNGSAVASLIEVMPSVSMIPVVIYDETKSGAPDAGGRRTDVKCIRKVLTTAESGALVQAVREIVE